jgi:hypothetical protein
MCNFEIIELKYSVTMYFCTNWIPLQIILSNKRLLLFYTALLSNTTFVYLAQIEVPVIHSRPSFFSVLLLISNITLRYVADTVLLEFNQYTPGSRWRQALVNRKDHREEGNEGDGFYGGIRKLRSKNDISKWRQLWPADILE